METTMPMPKYRWSEQRDKIAAALVAFQKTVAPVTKNKTAKVEKDGRTLYTYEYADLGDVIESTKEQRAAAGLAVVQFPTGDANGITIITTVLHSSGQWYEGELTLRPAGGKVQEIGSAITYGRRYCYAAALGLCTEVDDDGNAANGNDAQTHRREGKPPAAGGAQRANKVQAPNNAKMADAAQIKIIHVLKERIGGWTGKADHPGHPYMAALRAYKTAAGAPVSTSKDLTWDQAANLIMRMEGMVNRQADNLKRAEGETPIADAMTDREPGSDDDDTGEAPDPGLLQDVREAAKTRWGKKVGDLAPQWLQREFGVDGSDQLTKVQATRALQILLSGDVLQ